MTEQEAIERIKNDLQWHSKELRSEYKVALKLAITALEKQKELREKIEYIRQYCDTSDKNIKKQLSLLREFLIEEVADEPNRKSIDAKVKR